MKNAIKILILILGIQFTNAQEFQVDATYKVVINKSQIDKEASNVVASLVLREHLEFVLTSFKIEANNTIENIQIKSLKKPELKDVDDIIRIDFQYSEPFAHTISQYILMTNDTESILLPPIMNLEDESSNSEIVYVFPNQVLGNVNRITKLRIVYHGKFEIEDINILQNYAWNDSDNSIQNNY